MIEGFTAAEVREAERALLERGVPLMEHAAFALSAVIFRTLRDRSEQRRGPVPRSRPVERAVLLLVGAGNNGGDALLAGARLRRRGVRVVAMGTAGHVHAAALEHFLAAGGRWLPATDTALAGYGIGGYDVVVDGILGTGTTPDPRLRPQAAQIVRQVAAEMQALVAPDRPTVIAVDLPSGMSPDDGRVPEPTATLRADVTVTFGAVKAGLLLPPASGYAGHLVVVDLELPLAGMTAAPELPTATGSDRLLRLEPDDLARRGLIGAPARTAEKYSRGVLGVVAGTDEFPGAGVLAVSGASATGTGMIRYRGPHYVAAKVLARHPEVVTGEGRVQAWAIGSGLPAQWGEPHNAVLHAPAGSDRQGHGTTLGDSVLERAANALAEACGSPGSGLAEAQTPVPAVVDAGGLALLPVRVPASVVLTPHAGELAQLLSARGHTVERAQVEAEPLRWARVAHEETGASVLLKGAVTIVVGPGVVYAQDDATPWLATAGAGDVLAGILGALLARNAERVLDDPAAAAATAAAAALIHGRAAQRASGGGPIAAIDVAQAVPEEIAALLRGSDRHGATMAP